MTKCFSIIWVENGIEGRLGDERDCNKRKFYGTQAEAEHEAAFMRAVHPGREVSVQVYAEVEPDPNPNT